MSKQYNVKYEVGQDVYVLRDKKISKNRVVKIRVTEQQPYTKGNPDGTFTDMSGIEIDYLIVTKRDFIHPHTKRQQTSYDWYNEEDVFPNMFVLIAQIV